MDAPGTLLSRAPESGGGINNSVVVDDMKITNEKYAWGLVSETLAKHHLQRTEEELSRCMTLFLRLKAIADLAENDCMPKFTARLQMVKSARMLSVGPGVVLLSKGKEGDSETVVPPHEGGEDGGGGGNTRTAGFVRPQPPPTQQKGGGNNGVYLPDIRKTNSSLFGSNRNDLGNNNNNNNNNKGGSGGRSSPPRELTKKGSALQLMHSGGSAVLTSSVAMVGDYGLSSVGDEGNAGDADVNTGHGENSTNTNKMFYIIVEGEVALERPTINGRVRTEVHAGETIGNSLTMNALPPGSFYLTLSQTKLLAIPWLIYTQFMRDFDENEIRNRVQFFQEQVVVPVFAPFTEARFRWLARCCYQVHLRPKEIAVREGDLSDCVFFILSGKMKVIRAIDFSPSMVPPTITTTAGGDLHHPNSSGSPFSPSATSTLMISTTNGGSPTTATAPSLSSSSASAAVVSSNVKLLDLATLEPGEYFGELGILRRCVDQSVTCSLNDLLTITAEDIATIDNEREVTKIDASIASISRQATVYADTPASLLVIPRARFIELVQQGALVRFREYAKGYPSANAIRNHFVREHRWNVYKTKVYADDHTR